MLQRKRMGHLFVISVALLFVTVFGADSSDTVESNDIPQHQFHSVSVKNKDGSSSEATTSATTGKLPPSNNAATNSLPELLRRFNIQGFNFPTNTKDTATSASSVTNSVASANNNAGGGQSPASPFQGYRYPPPPSPPGTPPVVPPPQYPPWGIIPGVDVGIIKVVEKVILVIGGGILLLVILAVLKGAIAKGGFLNNFGLALSQAFSGATSGAFSAGAGPFQVSAAGSAAAASAPVNDPNFNRRVMDGVERRF